MPPMYCELSKTNLSSYRSLKKWSKMGMVFLGWFYRILLVHCVCGGGNWTSMEPVKEYQSALDLEKIIPLPGSFCSTELSGNLLSYQDFSGLISTP